MAEAQNDTMKVPVIERPAGVPADFDEHAKLMMDLQVIAFQADLTRVVTFMMGREGSNRSYRKIGISDGHHPLTHHQNDPEKIEKVTQIDTYHVKLLAYYLDKLQSHEGWRRHAARQFDGALRQQHLRRQRAHPSRSAAGAGGRRGRTDEGRPSH